MYKLLILLFFSFLSFCDSYASPLKISEAFLLEKAKERVPSLEEIEAQFLSTKSRALEGNEEFAPELFVKGSRAETNERALITFQPIFTPTTQTQLGLKQNLKYGASTSLSVYADERNSSSSPVAGNFRRATTMGANFTLQLDLWKNLLGRLSQAKLDMLNLEVKREEYQKSIQEKNFKLGLRKLYWALVANHESQKISEELLKTAKLQADEARRRFSNAIADADEVARYEAQVSSRNSSIVYLKYQRESILTQLRNLLPSSLGGAEIELAPVDLSITIGEVLSCTEQISKEKTVPFQNTFYDEIVEVLKKIQMESNRVTSRYSDLDVKLQGSLKTTGVSSELVSPGLYRGSYGGAFDDINNTNRTGYEIGLQVSLPLDSSKNETKKTKELYDEKRFYAAISRSESQVINTHKELVVAINYLNEVIKNQKLTSLQLEKRLKGMKRKYQQARVSVNELIMDQDALLNSELSIIQTQLQVINIVFDYLAVFTETPCGLNRI
jgi:outer membrane protein TolC